MLPAATWFKDTDQRKKIRENFDREVDKEREGELCVKKRESLTISRLKRISIS
jgi:hypothetical protein